MSTELDHDWAGRKRREIASREYDGPGSVGDAVTEREKMAATAELAKRAHVSEREWAWNAREAERTLGRMITAAREAGDLHGRDHGRIASDDPTLKLTDLGCGLTGA